MVFEYDKLYQKFLGANSLTSFDLVIVTEPPIAITSGQIDFNSAYILCESANVNVCLNCEIF